MSPPKSHICERTKSVPQTTAFSKSVLVQSESPKQPPPLEDKYVPESNHRSKECLSIPSDRTLQETSKPPKQHLQQRARKSPINPPLLRTT
eukprot:jgi/Botrbrau1/13503/Bobra.0082s0096.1